MLFKHLNYVEEEMNELDAKGEKAVRANEVGIGGGLVRRGHGHRHGEGVEEKV